uniref:Uncharacterized protein PFB0145c-like isoform X2 n=1 Tax=Dermatophagoides pteronyssinus TaxID=6956 RepID=A0A6P6XR14_DERPT|nr:uncharacterized protein PFB0145c-like isoform X2 [Dermatophagoides pteronyssinus]
MSQETDNAKILDEIDPNSEDWQHLFKNNGQARFSAHPRRSSILKLNEHSLAFADRRSSTRRVSWAQTFQYKEVLLDGTSVLTSQELNKYGPINPNAIVISATNEQKNDDKNENNSNNNSPKIINCYDENIQKIKNKFEPKHLPQVLSKYYNPKNDRKDYTTVINTALNKYGVEIDTANPINNAAKLYELFKRDHPSHEQNFEKFLKHLNLDDEPQQQRLPSQPVKASDSIENNINQTPSINSPTEKNFLNSTKISESHHSLSSFSIIDQSPIRNDGDLKNIELDSDDDDNQHSIAKTIHNTSFMQLESNTDEMPDLKKFKSIEQPEIDRLQAHDMSVDMSLELSPTKKSVDPMSIETVETLTSDTNMAISENFESDKPEIENEFEIFVDQSCIAAKMPGKESPKADAMNFLKKLDGTPNTDYSISFEEDDDDDNDLNLKNANNDKPEKEKVDSTESIFVDQSCIAAKMHGKESPKADAMNFLKKLDDTPNTDYSINSKEDSDDDNGLNLKNENNDKPEKEKVDPSESISKEIIEQQPQLIHASTFDQINIYSSSIESCSITKNTKTDDQKVSETLGKKDFQKSLQLHDDHSKDLISLSSSSGSSLSIKNKQKTAENEHFMTDVAMNLENSTINDDRKLAACLTLSATNATTDIIVGYSKIAEIITEMSQLKSTLPPPPSTSNSRMFDNNRRSMINNPEKYSSNFSQSKSNFNTNIIRLSTSSAAQTLSEQTQNLNDSLSSFYEKSILGRKSLGITIREKLLERVNQQRQEKEKEAEILESNETKESKSVENDETKQSQQIIENEESKIDDNVVDDSELQLDLNVTIESLQQDPDEANERVLSPIEMEQSIITMLDIVDLSHDSIESTETNKEAAKIIEDNEIENNDEQEKDYNLSVSETTGDFSMMMHDISRMVNDEDEMAENLEYSIFNQFEETIKLLRRKQRPIQIPMFDFINDLDHRKLNVRIQSVSQNLLVLRYLFSTLELRIHFGSIVTSKIFRHSNTNKNDDNNHRHEIREIVAIDVISLIDSNRPLQNDVIRGRKDRPIYNGDFFLLSFETDEHRRLLNLAQDYVLTHFEEKRSMFDKKFKDTSKLKELMEEFSILVTPAKKMACELRKLLSSEISLLLPNDSDGKIGLEEFIVALKMIKPCEYNYITRLIRGTRCFIRALKHVMIRNRSSQQQSKQIRATTQFEIPRSA